MAKGEMVVVRFKDGVTVGVDSILADKGGRTIDVEVANESGTKWLAVSVKTRGGTVVTKSTYRLDEVVSYTQAKGEKE